MYPVFVACLIRIESFIYLQQEMVIIAECARSDGKGDPVDDNLLVVPGKFILPPPNLILTAVAVICINLLFLI